MHGYTEHSTLQGESDVAPAPQVAMISKSASIFYCTARNVIFSPTSDDSAAEVAELLNDFQLIPTKGRYQYWR